MGWGVGLRDALWAGVLSALTAAIFGLEVGFGVLGDFGGEVSGLEVGWAVCLRGARAF